MALPQYSTQELIDNVKRRCAVPTSQLTYTDQDFSYLATDEMQGEVVPLIMSTREEYFVDFLDVTTTAGGVITIPEHAVGAKLRSVCYVQQFNPLYFINLPRLDLDVVAGVGGAGFTNFTSIAGFYIQGNQLMLYPVSSVPTGTNIRMYFYKRTLNLAAPSTYGQVLAVDTMANTIQVTFVPATWAVGTQLNAVSSKPNFDVTDSPTIVTLSAPSIVLDDVTGIVIGDYVSDLGFSAIPQIPIEAHAYLAQLTAVKALEGLGDKAGMETAQSKALLLRKSLLTMISQRVDGSIKKIVNPSGGLRANNAFWRGGSGGWGRF